jgi:signal transduction histidine kinase
MLTISSNSAVDQRTNGNSRLIARMRCILALAALLVIFIDPNEPDRDVTATYICLVLYFLFSFLILLLVSYNKTFIVPAFNNPYWLDVGWYLLLVSLSSGTSSIFFFFFYFAILNSSFSRGFRSGLLVAVTSAAGFLVIGYMTAIQPGELEVNRFLLRPLTLLALGYMIATWGGAQARNIGRMNLLKEISLISNPRFGADRTIAINLDLLRRFFGAESCFLISVERDPEQYSIRLSDRLSPEEALTAKPLDDAFGRRLIDLPGEYGFALDTGKLARLFREKKLDVFDRSKKAFLQVDAAPFMVLAETLEARSVLTAPVFHHGEVNGRLYLTSDRSFIFDRSDVEFLVQAIDHFTPIVENIQLVDRLASDAAEAERLKIARDIHDSIIQPFIGLQIGIESVLQTLERTDDEAKSDLGTLRQRMDRLHYLSKKGIDDLREYVSGLSQTRSTGAALLPSIRRYSEKFLFATGISVEVECPEGIHVSDRLAGEIFQIVAEGLSNIRRHTQSSWAKIAIAISDDIIGINISNESDGMKETAFSPRSITERASALGGSARTATRGGSSTVMVAIPL